MATETLNISVRSDGSVAVARDIESIGVSARRAQGGVSLLFTALRALSLGIIIKQVIDFADGFTNVQNKLRVVTTDTNDLNAVMSQLFIISNQTRTSFEANAGLYNRFANATKDLGLSQQEVLDITKEVNEAAITAGLKSSEVNGGIIQLTQGLAAGRLNGQELNSVLKELPPVAQLIADKMGVARGELKLLGKEGKITTDVIIAAFKDAKDSIEQKFAKTVPTIGQAFTVMRNEVIREIGEVNQAIGSNGLLSRSLLFIANNIQEISRYAAVMGAVLVAALAGPALIGGLIKVTQLTLAFFSLLLANPLVLLIALIAGAVAYIILFGDRINIAGKGLANLQDLGLAAWNLIQKGAKELADFLGTMFAPLLKDAQGYFTGTELSVKSVLIAVSRFGDQIIDIFAGAYASAVVIWNNMPNALAVAAQAALNLMIDIFSKGLNLIFRFFRDLPSLVGHQFLLIVTVASELIQTLIVFMQHLPEAFAQIFGDAMQAALGKVKEGINLIIDFFNKVPGVSISHIFDDVGKQIGAAGQGNLETLKTNALAVASDIKDIYLGDDLFNLGHVHFADAQATDLGKQIADAFKAGFDSGGKPIETVVQGLLADADAIAKNRRDQTAPPRVDLNAPGTPNPLSSLTKPLTPKAYEDLQKKLGDLEKTLDDVRLVDAGATLDLQSQQEKQLRIVQDALNARIINEKQAAQVIVSIYETTARKIRDIEYARYSEQLLAASSTFQSLTDIAKAFGGEQSGAYKVLFAASKAFAIADSIIKIQQGIANAFALPFPANLAAVATVAAAAASIVANIQAVSLAFADGGLVSGPGTGRSDSIPALLSNGEFVVNAASTKAFLPLLQNLNAGQLPVNSTPTAGGGYSGGGGSRITIQDNRRSGEAVSVQQSLGPDGIEEIKMIINDQVAQQYRSTSRLRKGEMLSAMKEARGRGNF